jgi:4-hydroxythreonine-4-phosphate dehydrogenase
MPSMTPVLIGSAHVLRVHADVLGFSDLDIHVVDEVPDEVPHGDVALLDVADDTEPPVMFGSVSPEGGRLAMRAVDRAVGACMAGTVDAMVTAPISKDAVQQAGYDVPGHTEYIARQTDSPRPTMMMVAGGLRVGLVTSHIPLSEVPAAVTEEAILEKLRVIDASLRDDFAIEHPEIAVFGLNPHAGEAGAFGPKEEEVIVPALQAARQEGFRVDGPLAADGFFGTQLDSGFDAALAMYHDRDWCPSRPSPSTTVSTTRQAYPSSAPRPTTAQRTELPAKAWPFREAPATRSNLPSRLPVIASKRPNRPRRRESSSSPSGPFLRSSVW